MLNDTGFLYQAKHDAKKTIQTAFWRLLNRSVPKFVKELLNVY